MTKVIRHVKAYEHRLPRSVRFGMRRVSLSHSLGCNLCLAGRCQRKFEWTPADCWFCAHLAMWTEEDVLTLTCIYAYMFTFACVRLQMSVIARLHADMVACRHAYMLTCLLALMLACWDVNMMPRMHGLHVCMRTQLHACVLACLPSCDN